MEQEIDNKIDPEVKEKSEEPKSEDAPPAEVKGEKSEEPKPKDSPPADDKDENEDSWND